MSKISQKGRGLFLAQSLERRSRKTVPRHLAEPLERRMLLSTSVIIGLIDPSQVFQFPGALISCETVPTPASTSNPQITGTFSVYWWNGKESSAGGAEPGGSPLATATLEPFGPNGGGYVTFEDVPLSPAAAAATGPITNDSVNGPVYRLVFIYNGGNYPATTAGGVAEVLANAVSTMQLAFIQNPSNTAAGDTIKPPVTVALEDSSGNIDTSASDIVTLAIASGSGILNGTVSEPVVNGIATFSDLAINAEGSYTLTASDATPSLTTAATSSLFSITGGKLVFVRGKTPTDGSAGEPLNPIEVELQDGKGNIDTTNNTTVVTLSPIGFTSGNPISGNTAMLVNGVATFSNVVLTKPDFYQLQAADGGDATSATPKFKVTGDHLKFIKQPANGDVMAPIPLGVEILNTKNQPDTNATTSLVLSLNRLTGGFGAQFLGTTTLPFVAGKAIFTTTAGPMIDTAGTYTLTATEEEDSTGVLVPTNTTTPITTKQFAIAGYQLKVLKQPANSDVLEPIPLSIEEVDAHGRRNTSQSTDSVQLGFTTISNGTGAQLGGTTTVTFVAGVATFPATATVSLNAPGTYTLDASVPGGAPSVTPAPVSSKQFQIKGYTLEPNNLLFGLPSTDDVPPRGASGQNFFFLTDAKGKHVPFSAGLPNAQVTLTAISGNGVLVGTTVASAAPLSSNSNDTIYSFDQAGITLPGKYTFTATAVDIAGETIPAAAIAPGKTKPFDVLPHSVGFLQPSRVTANETFSTVATLLQSAPAGQSAEPLSVVNAWVGVAISLVTYSGGAGAKLTGDTVAPLIAGSFNGLNLQIDVPGTYALKLTEVISAANAPFDPTSYSPFAATAPTITHPFKVLPDILVFTGPPPKTIGAGTAFPITVSIEDKSGKVITDINSLGNVSGVQLTATLIGTFSNQFNLEADFVNGVATFQQAFLLDPGKYILKATEVEFDPSLGNYEPDISPIIAQSAPVVVTPLL